MLYCIALLFMEKQVATYPTFKQGFGLLLLLIVAQIIIEIVSGILEIPKSGLLSKVADVTGYLLMYGTVIIYGYRGRRKAEPVERILLFKGIAMPVFSLIVIAFCFQAVIEEAVMTLLPPIPEWLLNEFKDLEKFSVYSFTLAIVVAPVCEEIIFRGIILGGFLKRFHTPAAIVLSSFLFGLMHMNIWQGVSAFLGGLLLGWVYVRTRSLVPCIFLHALNNSIGYIIPAEKVDINKTLSDFIGQPWYGILLCCSIVGFIITIYFLNRKFKAYGLV